nr:zinc finger, CCHC-type [Tanacetum cinerariifolium]
ALNPNCGVQESNDVNNDTIDEYAAKLSGIASKSATLEEVTSKHKLLKKFLTNLPIWFVHIVAPLEQVLDLETTRFKDVVDRLKAGDRFVVVAVEKIYAHELLTFNDTVAYDVISKWKARLKEDMDVRSYVYVLSNAEIWVTKGLLDKAKGNVLGMEIIKDYSGNTLRVSQSKFYNKKLVQNMLEGHFILSLEGSLSGDCDMEKNGKWSCIYAGGSQEYRMVCTRHEIASTDVDMLDKFDRGLQTDLQALSTTKAEYMTFTEAWKKEIWLKGLLTESRYELRLVAGIATCALVKGGSQYVVSAQVEVTTYQY